MTDAVAENEDDYVNLAVKYGTDPAARKELKGRLADNFHKLMGQQSAVDNWADTFARLAYSADKRCDDGQSGEPKIIKRTSLSSKTELR